MTLRISLCAGFVGIVLFSAPPVTAQQAPATGSPRTPSTSRQQPAAPQIDVTQELAALPQELREVLEQWYQSSQKIEKLHGEHCRFVYDYVFNVEKHAVGKFYYEAPSRGRIDLAPKKISRDKNVKRHPETRETAEFSVRPESAERWICDGEQILVIDETQKTVEQFEIPQASRGRNIMDGPLPFLFGMPPEKAVSRYQLRLENLSRQHFDLLAVPRWKQDAANYKWARIRIERQTMLPMAVQMLDPAGTRETVYTFPQIEKNPRPNLLTGGKLFQRIFGTSDPFRPSLRGYEVQAASQPTAGNRETAVAGTTPPAKGNPIPADADKSAVPAVIGFNYTEAEQIIKRSGYPVKFYRGEPATNEQLKFRVASQEPPPRTPLNPGQLVKLTLYTEPAPAGVPSVIGLSWKEAEALLKSRKLTVKFRRGKTAPRDTDVFQVYEQSPPGGTPATQGGNVTLTLYTKPATGSAKTAKPAGN